jgi:hypothetical protein
VHGLLDPTLAGEQEDEREQGDAQVEPERGIMDIPIVERAFFFGGYEFAG